MRADGTAVTGDQRLELASMWLARLREERDMSDDESLGWERFIAEPENQEAFRVVRRVAIAAPALKRSPEPSARELAEDEYDGSVSVREWNAQQAAQARQAQAARRRRWRVARWLASAATIAALALLGLQRWEDVRSSHASQDQAFETRTREHRDVLLADGSRIVLGAKTSLVVQYSAARRVIRLDVGEALFTVAHDASRPFVVVAGPRTVTAIGTQFNIRREPEVDRTTVTVTEGTVNIAPARASVPTGVADGVPRESTRLSKGQEITYAESGSASAVQVADLAAATAWREGRLVYRRTPLKYVIPDLNRYFTEQMTVDRDAGELQFSGAVLQTQPASEFLRGLEAIFPVEVIQTDADHYLIRSRSPDADQPR